MKYIIIFLALISHITHAQQIKIMTFNTMCDFCKGSNFSDYENRLQSIGEIIKTYSPDIVGLQELRTNSHVETLLQGSSDYQYITKKFWGLSYADPAIVFNKSKFKLITSKHLWLGPNSSRINFGWKFSLPRGVIWAEFEIIATKKKFIFMTTHFDNRLENLDQSSLFVNKLISHFNLPVLFAADTNLTTEMKSYGQLIGENLKNAFNMTAEKNIPIKSKKDLCYLKKGKVFPECRVDHVLITPRNKWDVKSYTLDVTKNYNNKFPSDHRPVIVELLLI